MVSKIYQVYWTRWSLNITTPIWCTILSAQPPWNWWCLMFIHYKYTVYVCKWEAKLYEHTCVIMRLFKGRYQYGGCDYLPRAIMKYCKIKRYAIISPKFWTYHKELNLLANTKTMYTCSESNYSTVSKTTTLAHFDYQNKLRSTYCIGNAYACVQYSRQQKHRHDFDMVTYLSPGRSPCIETAFCYTCLLLSY